MYNQEEGVVISWEDYYNGAKAKLIEECCVDDSAIEFAKYNSQMNGLIVIHLKTRNQDNVVGSYPGYNRLYKHVFLQNPSFKKVVIDYYKDKGFYWVDIVPINRLDWKIILSYPDVTTGDSAAQM